MTTTHTALPNIRTFRWIVLIVVMCSVISTRAQITGQTEETEETVDTVDTSRIDAMEAAINSVDEGAEGNRSEMIPALVPDTFLDDDGKQALQDSLRAYYDYRVSGFEHRRRVFDWQLLSSRIIFSVVILLVLVGMYFSWMQFQKSLNRTNGSDEPADTTTIEASAADIKVSSPVLGVIILVISLLFFYLYLVHVYPIEEIL